MCNREDQSLDMQRLRGSTIKIIATCVISVIKYSFMSASPYILDQILNSQFLKM